MGYYLLAFYLGGVVAYGFALYTQVRNQLHTQIKNLQETQETQVNKLHLILGTSFFAMCWGWVVPYSFFKDTSVPVLKK